MRRHCFANSSAALNAARPAPDAVPRPPLVIGTWGSVSRTKRGCTWVAYARFRDFDGVTRQVERQGATGRKAEDALLRELRDRIRVPGADMSGETRIRELAETWIDGYAGEGHAYNTVEQYRRVLRLHVLPGLGNYRLREASVPTVERFLNTVLKEAGPGPARHSRIVLKAMFALAVRHGAIPTNPARDTAPVKRDRREIQTIDPSSVAALRRQLRDWDADRDRAGNVRLTDLADVVDMLLATGVRTGEVLALRWRDVTLGEAPQVEIRGTVVLVRGEGLIVQDRPKSDTSRRILLLPPFAVEMLQRRRRESDSEWVFPSSTGTLRSPSNFRRQWRDFRQANGYDGWVTPKTFRKTVATLVRDHVDLEAAGAQLGHANTKVTAEHYAKRVHLAPDLTEVLQQFGT